MPRAWVRTIFRPMDRDTHRRFLQYLESFPYWNSPHAKKLGRDEFVELDAEMQALDARGKDGWTADDIKRVAFLRKKLLRDW